MSRGTSHLPRLLTVAMNHRREAQPIRFHASCRHAAPVLEPFRFEVIMAGVFVDLVDVQVPH